MRARRLSEVLSPWSDVWKEWELRGAVFLSLVLQVFLIYLGDRRKYVPHAWIRVVTWSAYLLADSIAIYALGMISNTIGEIKFGKSVNKMDPHAELSTFWAPFLLLHLGGPDTISAYAMEDNELWLRHSLTLVNQTGLTVYVLVMAWTHPILSFLTILILLSGFYKYGERVWVLRAASNEHLEDSLVESQPQCQYSNKIVEECELKVAEGYNIVPHQVIEVRDDTIADLLPHKLSSGKDFEDLEDKGDVCELLVAYSLVDTSQRLFADYLFSLESKLLDLSRFLKDSRELLHDKHIVGAFKVIEIELGLIYDLFYAKAKAVYTIWGFICRLTISFLICLSLVVFSLQDKRRYLKADLCLTFLLLGSAIFLELYALSHILFSDRFACWLIKNKQLAVFNFVNRIQPLSKRFRWSNSIGQCNLMSFVFKENDSYWWRFLKLLHVEEMGLKFLYHDHVDVSNYIKELILSKIKGKEPKDDQELPSLWIGRGGHVLSTHNLLDLNWSIELEFDMSILVWHIATELCYYPDREDFIMELDRNNMSILIYSLTSLHMSRYMLHLLVMYPSMLPLAIGSIRFRDIYKASKKYCTMPELVRNRPAHGHDKSERMHNDLKELGQKIERNRKIKEAFEVLRSKMETKFSPSGTKEDRIDYAVFNGCRLALNLGSIPSEVIKWDIIRQVWAEMLIYAASKCKAMDHAQQMRRGGELITHVWLLMAHYGLTNNFQIPRTSAMAEIMVNSW